MKELDEKYIARCHRKLKEYGAPLSGWYCVEVIDIADEMDDEDATTECELCGCKKVRYIHVMRHDDYFDDFRVGCICAGIMEGDILEAKDRERRFKNRQKRKLNFPRRKWRTLRNGNYYLNYHDHGVFINRLGNGRFYVRCGNDKSYRYKGRPIDNFLSAAYAAFDLADPKEAL
jgi:hypothetical protein